MTWQTSSTNSENTEQLAARVGARLRGGEVFELISDLGGGKTAFVRGLARGMGSTDHVASPTFTISREYRSGSGKLALHHFDLYRLPQPGLVAAELAEVLDDPAAVTVIEWGDSVQGILPAERLAIQLERSSDVETSRRLTFSYPPSLAYLIQ